jgi:hypothetical protein
MFGNYRVQPGLLSLGTKYTVEEEIMPIVERIYACGRLVEQGGAIAAPGWRSLILSTKSRDELLSSATKGAKAFLIAGAAVFVVGSGLAILGQLTASDGPAAASASASSAPATSASTAIASATLSTATIVASTLAAPTPKVAPSAAKPLAPAAKKK